MPPPRRLGPDLVSAEFREFWTERRICSLATVGVDGTPHVVAIGVTVDVEQAIARVITSRGRQKVRNVERVARVAVTGIDGARWSTLQGSARVVDDPVAVADAERRYALRYRVPRANPDRVVIEIAVDRVLGPVR